MNRKGFTLIELLAVVVLIALISVLIVPNVLDTMNKSKQKSYDILIKNIVTASWNYYFECENGDLSKDKYGDSACKIKDGNDIEITLGDLVNSGMLSVADVDKNGNMVVLNPKKNSNTDMSNCKIKITKKKEKITDDNGVSSDMVTYTITSVDNDNNCPTNDEYKNVSEVSSNEVSG